MIIPIKKDEGMVTLKINIQGTVTWDYRYYEDQTYHNDSIKNNPKIHLLGLPHDLTVKKHEWDHTLINPSDAKISVDVIMKWYQVQNNIENQIAEWKIENHVIPASDHASFSDHGYIVIS